MVWYILTYHTHTCAASRVGLVCNNIFCKGAKGVQAGLHQIYVQFVIGERFIVSIAP